MSATRPCIVHATASTYDVRAETKMAPRCGGGGYGESDFLLSPGPPHTPFFWNTLTLLATYLCTYLLVLS